MQDTKGCNTYPTLDKLKEEEKELDDEGDDEENAEDHEGDDDDHADEEHYTIKDDYEGEENGEGTYENGSIPDLNMQGIVSTKPVKNENALIQN